MSKGSSISCAVALLALTTTAATADTFNQRFCRQEHPGDVSACVGWLDQQDHKLFIGETGQPAHSPPTSENVTYDKANEARKLLLRMPVPGEIPISDGRPAKEIPLR